VTPNESIETGKSLYQQARFPEAIETLRRAVERMEGNASDEQRRQRLVDAYRYLGLAYFALGERDIARDAFKNVLSLNPNERLDPELYAPRVVELFEQARLLAVPLGATSRDPSRARERARRERRPFGPKFAVELWGGVDRFPGATAPSPGYESRLKAGGVNIDAIAVDGGRGQFGAVRLSLRLGNGADRLSIGLEPVRTGSRRHVGTLGANDHGQDFSFEHEWDLNAYEWRFTWSHRVLANEAWTLWTDTSYRNAWLSHDQYNLLTPATAAARSLTQDNYATLLNNGDSVHVDLHGLRAALSISRRLSQRLSIEGSLGYTLALRNVTYDPAIADTPAGYELSSSFDVSVGARLALTSQLAFSLLYRQQSYGQTYLGDLRSSNYLAALTIHSSH